MADLLLRGGRVIDPSQGIDARLDVHIREGLIAELRSPDAPLLPDADVRDVAGAVVTPGLVDLHGHWYEGSAYGIDPTISLRSGVTTAVDAGTAGFVNFASFRRQTIDPAPLRVLAFVNIAALGIPVTLSGELDTPAHVRPSETVETIRAHQSIAVGVKVRLSAAVASGGAPAALDLALEASQAVGLPLMVDVGGEGDFMPDALDHLGVGDILTHCFTGGGATIIDEGGRVRREAREARQRGVLFDIGHGCGSFSWKSARAAIADDFPPDSISTDLHYYSLNGPAYDQYTMMAKFLHLGFGLPEVVARVTTRPAAAIGIAGSVSLRPGSPADVAVFRVTDDQISLRDAAGTVETGDQRLEPVLTVVRGRPVEPGAVAIVVRPQVEADRSINCN
jgi:dihydroorotase